MFVPNFKILSQVVSEKSLTEKKFTDRQTDRQTNKHPYRKGKNYIPQLSYRFLALGCFPANLVSDEKEQKNRR